jgi:integrase
VEYAVAVDAYLGQAPLSAASRRVYRISLAGWAWPLVGQPIPGGAGRRGAAPPVVPLALLDDPGTAGLLAQAFADRAAGAGARTANRELSALRGAAGWWQDLGWIRTDPTAGLRHRPPDELAAPLDAEQAGALFRLPASLREQAFWRLLYDSGAPAAAVLALSASQLDLDGHRVRRMPGGGVAAASAGITWGEPAGQFLRWLLAGRTWGPVFVTGRRAAARTARGSTDDLCRPIGQARLSYRRAAEIFTAATRPLDPAGCGWTLHQLSAARSARPGAPVRPARTAR